VAKERPDAVTGIADLAGLLPLELEGAAFAAIRAAVFAGSLQVVRIPPGLRDLDPVLPELLGAVVDRGTLIVIDDSEPHAAYAGPCGYEGETLSCAVGAAGEILLGAYADPPDGDPLRLFLPRTPAIDLFVKRLARAGHVTLLVATHDRCLGEWQSRLREGHPASAVIIAPNFTGNGHRVVLPSSAPETAA
jgi:hypothetical protein